MQRKISFLVLPLALGCQPAQKNFPGGLTENAELTLYGAPSLPCGVQVAESLSELKKDEGVPLQANAAYQKPRTFRLARALDQGEWWALSLANDAESLWARVPKGTGQACLLREPAQIARFEKELNKNFAYEPWKASCRTIEAFGKAPEALLVDSEPGLALKLTGLRVLAETADQAAKGKSGTVLWYSFGDQLNVRDDTFHGCFSAFGESPAPRDDEFSALIQTPRARCAVSDGGNHLHCSSSIGGWEGAIAPTSLRLSRINQTIGPVHFWHDQPVDGHRFARTLIAFALPNAKGGPEMEALYQAIVASASRALSQQSANEIRLVKSDDESATHRVSIEVSNLTIGNPESSTEKASSSYKSGEREVANPERPAVVARLEEARLDLPRAQRDYDESVRQFEQAKRIALEECRRIAAQQKDDAKTYSNIACDVGQIAASLIQPSRDELDAAEQELSESRQLEASTPETVMEDIYSPWTYERRVYRRSAAAELLLTVQSGSEPPLSAKIPFRNDWTDYEVAADPEHAVEGHQIHRPYLDSSTAFLEPIGAQISEVLARRLTTVLRTAALDAARKSFARQEGAQTRVGFEDVDAVAFDVAGERLGRAEVRGRATLTPEEPFELPTEAVALRPDECLLIVAVETISGESAGLTLTTTGRRTFDRRKAARAFVEICPEDRPDGAQDSVQILSAAQGTEARFGLYRTKSTSQTTTAAKSTEVK